MAEHLTSDSYWDRFYGDRPEVEPVDLGSWRRMPERRIFEIKQRFGVDQGSVLEVGGGFSPWLTFLCQRYPDVRYACLDFSKVGVEALTTWKSHNDIANLDIYYSDFFQSPEHRGQFDLVFSHGVVEHFKNLPSVLRAHATFLAPNGTMITVIPNLSGVLGTLTKLLNREVYETHIPHDLQSFRRAHDSAGLQVVESGYVCATNFGVLSSCLAGGHGLKAGFKTGLYKALLAISLLDWRLESLGIRLPRSRAFSPYVYAVARPCGRVAAPEGP